MSTGRGPPGRGPGTRRYGPSRRGRLREAYRYIAFSRPHEGRATGRLESYVTESFGRG